MSPIVSVLALFAHPDDAEFLCAGTLAHLADRGARIHIATMTGGDCGSTVLPPDKIARVRQKEAARAAKLIGAAYSCLKEKDLLVFYDSPTLRKVMELLRRVNADVVFTHSPTDYMADHETTSRLAQSACFGGMIGNFKTKVRHPAPPLRRIPYLYYAQPFGGRDILGEEIRPKFCVDISATIERKEKMLTCHESQRAFLRAQQEIQDTLGTLREMARHTGESCGFPWAEGFRQHLGQGFPLDHVLLNLLCDLVRPARK